MKTSTIMDLINEVEARYAVDQWTIDGIHIWPYLRIKLNFDLYYAYHVKPKARTNDFTALGARALEMARNVFRFAYASLKDSRNNAGPQKQVDVAFISDGLSYAFLRDAWYEKYCDPLITQFHQEGLSTYLMSLSHAYHIPRHTPSRFMQVHLDSIKIRSLLLPSSCKCDEGFAREYSACFEYLNSKKLKATIPGLDTLKKHVTAIRRIADLYCGILRKLNPSLVFVVSYYGIEGMALNLACRELGIPCVDLQHGVQGDLHVAYARWNKVPESGYELLPSYFWCWSNDEADTIRSWSAAVARWHQPLVGGNLWLNQWQDGNRDFVEYYDNCLKNILARYSGHRHILVTLQFGLADETTLAPLLKVMQHSKQKWRWWIRLHPCMLRERQQIRTMMQNHGITDIELDVATDYPLYALLRHMDLHLTHSSSTVIEAKLFNIPSVVISEYGSEFFPEQIASGWARPAYSTDDIVTGIQEQLEKTGDLPKRAFHQGKKDDSHAIDQVMQLAKNRIVHGFQRKRA